MLGLDFEDEVWSRFVFELVIWPNRLLCKDELNPRVRCAFGDVYEFRSIEKLESDPEYITSEGIYRVPGGWSELIF